MFTMSLLLLALLYLLRYGQKTAGRFAKLYGAIKKPNLAPARAVVRTSPARMDSDYSLCCSVAYMCSTVSSFVGGARNFTCGY